MFMLIYSLSHLRLLYKITPTFCVSKNNHDFFNLHFDVKLRLDHLQKLGWKVEASHHFSWSDQTNILCTNWEMIFASIVIIIGIVVWRFHGNRKYANLLKSLPHPKGYPLVGNILELTFLARNSKYDFN